MAAFDIVKEEMSPATIKAMENFTIIIKIKYIKGIKTVNPLSHYGECKALYYVYILSNYILIIICKYI